jgi:hypothetical protein
VHHARTLIRILQSNTIRFHLPLSKSLKIDTFIFNLFFLQQEILRFSTALISSMIIVLYYYESVLLLLGYSFMQKWRDALEMADIRIFWLMFFKIIQFKQAVTSA